MCQSVCQGVCLYGYGSMGECVYVSEPSLWYMIRSGTKFVPDSLLETRVFVKVVTN